MARTTMNHPAARVALAASAMALCCLTVALAYREGKRRGRSEGVRRVDASDGERRAEKSSSGKKRAEKSSGDASRAGPTNEIGDAEASSSPYASLPVEPIGTLRSIYRLCVGTPRQGMLAPHSRGVVTFDETKVSKDAIVELQNYSHVFVVFVFHLNSNGKNDKNNGDKNGRKGKGQFTSKIAPPSLGGKKVGIFSTRTPHRPNPIGFSLCRLDKVIVHNKKKSNQLKQQGKGGGTFSLLLSGLDIVDGTPILDIKPYVPHYDCVGYTPPSASTTSTAATDAAPSSADLDEHSTASAEINSSNLVRVPHWVDSGLQKRRNVTFLPAANQFLQDLSGQHEERSASSSSKTLLKQIEFYGPHSPWEDSPDQSVQYLKQCILELLGVDVRSAWQTKKARKGKFQAERSSRVKEWKGGDGGDTGDENATARDAAGGAENGGATTSRLCTQQIDNLLVRYTIEEPGSALYDETAGDESLAAERSMGSGAEDIVVVHSISLIK